jgi:steroid delta-isomerase-like uncharacterized protein
MTTTLDNHTLARRILDAIDRHDWPAVEGMTAPGLRVRIGGQDIDFASWRGMGQMFAAAFPDGKHEVEQIVAEGDRVVARCTWTGTHRGAFQGIPASGRAVALTTFLELRIREGRLVEYRGLFDALGMMQHIGALPGA